MTVIVSYSGASQAVLRAVVDVAKDENGTENRLAGLLMIAPGVGIDLKNYMERILPGSCLYSLPTMIYH